MTGFGIDLKGRSVDGLNVGDKEERKGGQVSLQIPWLGSW